MVDSEFRSNYGKRYFLHKPFSIRFPTFSKHLFANNAHPKPWRTKWIDPGRGIPFYTSPEAYEHVISGIMPNKWPCSVNYDFFGSTLCDFWKPDNTLSIKLNVTRLPRLVTRAADPTHTLCYVYTLVIFRLYIEMLASSVLLVLL